MASAGNVNLGAIVSMTDASVAQPYPVYFGNAAGAAPDAAVKTPVQVGTQDVSVVIQVVFAIG
jgi:uncharacterized protein YggE